MIGGRSSFQHPLLAATHARYDGIWLEAIAVDNPLPTSSGPEVPASEKFEKPSGINREIVSG
jgi:hypothetical protein